MRLILSIVIQIKNLGLYKLPVFDFIHDVTYNLEN